MSILAVVFKAIKALLIRARLFLYIHGKEIFYCVRSFALIALSLSCMTADFLCFGQGSGNTSAGTDNNRLHQIVKMSFTVGSLSTEISSSSLCYMFYLLTISSVRNPFAGRCGAYQYLFNRQFCRLIDFTWNDMILEIGDASICTIHIPAKVLTKFFTFKDDLLPRLRLLSISGPDWLTNSPIV